MPHPRPGEPGGVAIAGMLIWLILAVVASWVLGVLVKGLGSGEAPAEGILMVAGLVGAPAIFFLFAGLAMGGVQPLLRLTAVGSAVLAINAGLLCRSLATRMDSRYYDYSLLDRHPQLAGGVIVAAGVIGLAAIILYPRLRRGRR